MKKKYEELLLEIIELIDEDVLTASVEGNYDKNGWQ